MTSYRKVTYTAFGFVFLSLIALFLLVKSVSHKGYLTISFLNIGQGDGIYIEAPNGKQIMIDGGPEGPVLGQLGRVMPFFDRTIDALLITNPDSDHIGGFLDIMKRYKVDYLIEPGTHSPSATYAGVESLAQAKGLQKIIARRGMDIVLDREDGVYIRILFPDRDVSTYTTNDGSIVAKLVYGKTSVMLEGDAPQKTEKYLLTLDQKELDSDILKVGHHGSRTATVPEYVQALSPDYAVISCGVDNKYGHPHKETLDTLNAANVPILRTDLEGRITFVSDGESLVRTE